MRLVSYLIFNILFLYAFGLQKSYAQQTEPSVNAILLKAQKVYTSMPNYNLDVAYKMYGNYTTNETLESYTGKMIYTNKSTYLKIHNTIFLTSTSKKTSIKIFKDEKVMEVANQSNFKFSETSPINIDNFIKLFKYKELEDKSTYYVCKLTTDKITQIPYGRVELYINKTDYTITKQVLYFLAKVPYKDRNGDQQEGNPRIEISISNFEKTVSSTLSKATNFSQYVTQSNGKYVPSAAYKGYEIIQN